MKTITTFAQIAEDGVLRLEVPCGLSSGLAEVAIVVHLLTETEVITESPTEKRLPDISLPHVQADKYLGTDGAIDPQETNATSEEDIEEENITEAISQQISLADLLEGYIGVIDSSEYIEGESRMSEDTGEKFAQMMIQKREQGHL